MVMLHAVFRFLVLMAFVCAGPALAGQSLSLSGYKELRNDYVKVTDVKERERFEERYLEKAGKVTLQKVPYKEVLVTAEMIQKPPSSMDTVFGGEAAQPFLKICMAPFDAAGKALDESCESFKFQSFVRGNIGTAMFRLDPDAARYDFRMIQRQGDKGSAIKLWVPTN
jgi:hypothetical protein